MNLKKILALVLVLTMCLSLIPTYAFAEDDGIELVEEEPDIVEVVDEPEEEPAAEPAAEEAPAEPVVEEVPEEPAPEEEQPAQEPEEEEDEEEEEIFGGVADEELFEAVAVAQIGGLTLPSIAQAIDAADETDYTITLLANTEENITVNKPVTLTTTTNVTVKGNATVTLTHPETATFTNVTFDGDVTVNSGKVVFNSCTITGTLTLIDGEVIMPWDNLCTLPIDAAIMVEGGLLTIAGGTFYGDVEAAAGVTKGNITGGTFNHVDKVLLADWCVTVDEHGNSTYDNGKTFCTGTVDDLSASAMVGTGAERFYGKPSQVLPTTKVGGTYEGQAVTLRTKKANYTFAGGQVLKLVDDENGNAAAWVKKIDKDGGPKAPSGYILTTSTNIESGVNIITIEATYYVAEYNGETYDSFKEAVEAIPASDENNVATVTVLHQPEEDDVATLSKTVSVIDVELANAEIEVKVVAKGNEVGIGIQKTKISDTKYRYEFVAGKAKIGDNIYETLELAVDAANASEDASTTITLLADVELADDIVLITTNTNIALGGFTVTGGERTITVAAGEVSFENGTIAADVFCWNDATVTLPETVTVEGYVVAYDESTLNVYGTVIDASNQSVAAVNVFDSANVYVFDGAAITGVDAGLAQLGGTVTVSGGTISGLSGVYTSGGELIVTDGEINGAGEKANEFVVQTPTGDALVIAATSTDIFPTVMISGGTFTSENAAGIGSYETEGAVAPALVTIADSLDVTTNGLVASTAILDQEGYSTYWHTFTRAADYAIDVWELGYNEMPTITLNETPTPTDVYELQVAGNTFEYLMVQLNGKVTQTAAAGLVKSVDPDKAIKVTPDESVEGLVKLSVDAGAVIVMTKDGDIYKADKYYDTIEAAIEAGITWATQYIVITESRSYELVPGQAIYVATETNAVFTPSAPDGYTVKGPRPDYSIAGLFCYELELTQGKVTFNPNDGYWPTTIAYLADDDGNMVEIGTYTNIVPTPTEFPIKNGEFFVGWFDAPEGGNQYGTEAYPLVFPYDELVLYAQYTEAVALLVDKGGNNLYYTTVEEALESLADPAHTTWFEPGTVVTLVNDAEYALPATDTTLQIKLDGHELTITNEDPDEGPSADPFGASYYVAEPVLDEETGVSTYKYAPYVAQVMTQTYEQQSVGHDGEATILKETKYQLHKTFEQAAEATLTADGNTTVKTLIMMAPNEEAYQLTAANLGDKVFRVCLNEQTTANLTTEAGKGIVEGTAADKFNEKTITTYALTPAVTVSFYLNYEGASEDPIVKTVDASGKVQAPDLSSERIGYQVEGWYLYAKPAYNDKPVDVTGTFTEVTKLYAKWESVATGSLTFTVSDHVTQATSTTLTGNYGAAVPDLEAFMATVSFEPGYEFDTWCSDAALATPTVVPETFPAEAMSFYAKPTLTEYTIEYNLVGGSPWNNDSSRYPETYTLGDTFTVPNPVAPTSDEVEFEFAGWKWTVDGVDQAAITDLTTGFVLSSTQTGNLVLTAQWTMSKSTYQFVDLDRDGETLAVYASGYYAEGEAITVPVDPSKDGWKFDRFVYKTANDDVPVTTSPVTLPAGTGNVTFFATWTSLPTTTKWYNDETLMFTNTQLTKDEVAKPSYNSTSGTFTFSGASPTSYTPKKEGYRLDPNDLWTSEIPKYTDIPLEFSLNWKKVWTVDFVYEEAMISSIIVFDGKKPASGSIPGIVNTEGKPGYWIDKDGNYFDYDTVVTDDMTLSVTWTAPVKPEPQDKDVTVRWFNGETLLETDVVKSGSAVSYDGEEPTKENGIFIGWNTNAAATSPLNPLPAANNDINFYAIFSDEYGVKAGYTVGVGSSFDIGFKVNTIPAGSEASEYSIVVDGKEVVSGITLRKWETVKKLAAHQMSDIVKVEVKRNDKVVFTGEYSIRGYVDAKLDKTDELTVELANLLHAIVDYGSYAQERIPYKVNELANHGVYSGFTEIVPRGLTNGKEGAAKGITGMTYALSTESMNSFKVSIKHEADAVMSDYTFTVTRNNQKVNIAPTDENNKYVFLFDGIAATQLGDEFVITVTDGDGSSYVVTTSPVIYMSKLAGDSNAILSKIGDALFNYFMTAVDYINSLHQA